jgi:syntaxin 8
MRTKRVVADLLLDQDTQLDHLSEAISRQKHIGLLISDELDLHIDLIEETEEAVESTQSRLNGASRSLRDIHASSQSNWRGKC